MQVLVSQQSEYKDYTWSIRVKEEVTLTIMFDEPVTNKEAKRLYETNPLRYEVLIETDPVLLEIIE